MKVLFCTSNLPGAVLIRGVTWSKWSHVALVLDDGTAIEATWPKVRRVALSEILAKHSKYVIVDIPVDYHKVVDAAMSQIGKPYDITSLFGILVHRSWSDTDSWFCSELVAWSFAQSGNSLFREEDVHRITPQNLWTLNYPIVEKEGW